MVKRNIQCVSIIFPTLIAAVLYFIPVLGPFLTPFKIAPTAHAGLGCKSIFNFGRAGHGAMLDAKSTEGGICEDRTLAVGCLYEFYYVI